VTPDPLPSAERDDLEFVVGTLRFEPVRQAAPDDGEVADAVIAAERIRVRANHRPGRRAPLDAAAWLRVEPYPLRGDRLEGTARFVHHMGVRHGSRPCA
jgi:hypothetical protein